MAMFKKGKPYPLLVTVVLFAVCQAAAHGQRSAVKVDRAINAMQSATSSKLTVKRSAFNGLVRFLAVGAPGSASMGRSGFLSSTPADNATAFLASYKDAFGIQGKEDLWVLQSDPPDQTGMEHVRVQQLYRGIPVTGGQFTVHIKQGGIKSVLARTIEVDRDLDINPAITPGRALSIVQSVIYKTDQVSEATLSSPRLEVFNRGLLEGNRSVIRLAWFIEVGKVGYREYLWIDARTGALLLKFSQLTDAKSRTVYDAGNTASTDVSPGTECRTEGGPAAGAADCDNAYDYSGSTYDYYFTYHSRDSYDGNGAALLSTVRHCEPGYDCPYANAYWDGVRMVYGQGYASAEDVVGHELTHAVTEHSANLFYYMQSGALNESFSDIFGETIDLLYSGGDDSPAVRWYIGEDLPPIGANGAIRNMMDPTLYNDPGKISDAQFVCATPGNDGGGVHSNSGVPNHAYALMVDGGTYNSTPVSPIGLTKAGKIQYRALTRYLVSASDFLDDADALTQSCVDLIGVAGITQTDCNAVADAVNAVEMTAPWPCRSTPASASDACPAGDYKTVIFADDLENTSSGNWSSVINSGLNHWSYPAPAEAILATSGIQNIWGDDAGSQGDSAIEMASSVPIPGGSYFFFRHSFGFEDGYDGGVVEYSTDGGAVWHDAGSLISGGAGYGGVLPTTDSNPLGGRSAFTNDSFGYTASKLDLASLAGQDIRFRFRIGTDPLVGDYGWFIDDIEIYSCQSEADFCFPIKVTSGKVAMICL